jgi:glycosidase
VPFLYYGEEIGMKQERFPFKAALDPIPKKFGRFANFLARLSGESMNRDECRTPMPWDSTENAGFSKGKKTWLPLGKDYKTKNVQREEANSNSLFHHYQNLLKLRKEHQILALGQVEKVEWKGKLLCITRSWEGKKALLVYNFGKGKKKIEWPEGGKLYSLTHSYQRERNKVAGWEGVVWWEE